MRIDRSRIELSISFLCDWRQQNDPSAYGNLSCLSTKLSVRLTVLVYSYFTFSSTMELPPMKVSHKSEITWNIWVRALSVSKWPATSASKNGSVFICIGFILPIIFDSETALRTLRGSLIIKTISGQALVNVQIQVQNFRFRILIRTIQKVLCDLVT